MKNVPSKTKSLPSYQQVSQLASLLQKEIAHQNRAQRYATTKEILLKIGKGAILMGTLLAPKAGYEIAKEIIKHDPQYHEWKSYNSAYLRQSLRRMSKQKLISIDEKNGMQRVTLTEKGRVRIFEYSLEHLSVQKRSNWDKKWRVVIYDIPTSKRQMQEHVRKTLRKLGFLQIQKSIYVIPYPCYEEIEFLREYYEIGQFLKYMLVTKLEDDSAYKKYFDIK